MSVKDRNKTITGTGLTSGGHGDAWRIGPRYDEKGGLEGTEDLYLSSKYRDSGNQGMAAGRALSERMTGYSRRGGRRDTEWVKEGGSIWKNVAMVGAATAGIGVAGTRLWSSRGVLQDLFAGAKASVVAAAAPTFAQEFISRYERVAPEMQAEMMRNAVEAIRNLGKTKGGVAPEVARALWVRSRTRGDPRGIVSGALAEAADPLASILSAAEQHLQGGKIHPAWPRTLKSFQGKLAGIIGDPIATEGFGAMTAGAGIRSKPLGLEEITSPMLRQTLADMQKSLRASLRLSLNQRTVTEGRWVGGEYEAVFTRGELGGEGKLRLRIPRSLTAEEVAVLGLSAETEGRVIATGAAQSSFRAPGLFAEFAEEAGAWTQKSSFKYEEWVALKYQAEILPQILSGKLRSQREIRRAVSKLDQEVLLAHAPLVDPLGAPMQARIRASSVHAYLAGGGVPSEMQQKGIMRAMKGKLFGGLTPKRMAGGETRAPILSTLDPAVTSVLGHTPIARRPWQGLTKEYFPTPGAQAAMRAHPVHARSGYLSPPWVREQMGEEYVPHFRTQYVSERHVAEMSKWGLNPGEAMMLPGLRRRIEVQRSRPIYLDPATLSMSLADPARGEASIKVGQVLGLDPAGKPVKMKKGWEILDYEMFPGRLVKGEKGWEVGEGGGAGEQIFRLRVRETSSPERTPKFFGLKADVLETGGGRFKGIRTALGVGGFGEEAIFMGDLLRKDRSRHNLQMFSALVEFTHENLWGRGKKRALQEQLGYLPSPVERMLVSDPGRLLAGIGAMRERMIGRGVGMKEIENITARYIYRLSKSVNLTPAQTGRVFGLLPDVLGVEAGGLAGIGFKFNPWELKEIGKGVATGVASMHYGGLMKLTGAGAKGALEPRAWEILSGPHAGALGGALKTEFMSRVLTSHPQLAQGQSMLSMALAEMAGEPYSGNLPEGIRRLKLGDLTEEMLDPAHQAWVGREGALVETGLTGAKNIFVPPEEMVGAMKQKTPTGGLGPITSDLAAAYATTLKAAQVGDPATAASIGDLTHALGAAHSATIRRTLGSKTKMPGTRFLRIRSPEALRSTSGAGTFMAGVPFSEGRRMIGELMKLYPEDKGAIEGLLQRFEAGEVIGGAAARHPIFGPYNVSPIGIYGISTPEAIIEMPSKWVNVNVPSMPGVSHMVDIGPMAGWAADKDADTLFTSVLRPRAEKEAMSAIGSQAWRTHYENFVIRDQILKNLAKAGGGKSLTAVDEMIADTLKLGTPQKHVPLISSNLTQARRRVLASSLAAENKMNLHGLFSILEQVPISGKHLSTEEVLGGALGESLRRMSSGLRQGAGGEVVEAARELFKHGGPLVGAILGEGFEAEIEGVTRRIPGINLSQVGRDFSQAFAEVPRSQVRQMNLLTSLGKKKSKLRLKPEGVSGYLKSSAGLFSGAVIPLQTGTMATVSKTTTSFLNEAAALGRGAMRIASKPLAWGFGGAIGLGLILSKPMGTLKPGDSAPPASGMMPPPDGGMGPAQNVHPDQQVAGEPSIPRSIPPGDASIAPMSYGKGTGRYNIDVHGGTGKNMDYQQIAALVRQRLGRAGQANIHVQDRRSTLTPQKLNDIMG